MPTNSPVNWTCATTSIVYLTYSQVGNLDVSDIQAHLDCLGADHHVCGHELHQDGGHHYHCVAHFDHPQHWRDARVFDVRDKHPNVKVVRGAAHIARVVGYVTKEGDAYASSELAEAFFNSMGEPGKRSRDAIWGEIIGAGDAATFWELVKSNAPYEYATRYTSLVDYVAAHYNKEPYIAPDVTFARVPDEMTDWVDNTLVCVSWYDVTDFQRVDRTSLVRPKALVIVGATQLGKTVWARSHGRHSYFNGLFNIADYDDECKYAIFDDIDCEYFPHYKGWFGGQQQFTISGKYARHRTISWGRPIIWLSNNDPRYSSKWDRDWLEGNCVFIHLFDKLYDA